MQEIIVDQDNSAINYKLSLQIPINRACGYNFCTQTQASTQSDSSQANFDFQDKKNTHMSSHKQLYEKGINLLSKIQEEYKQHRIDEAYKFAIELISLNIDLDKINASRHLLETVKRQMTELQQYQKIIRPNREKEKSKWEVKKKKKDLKVSTKIQNETVGVLIQAYVDVPLEEFFAVVSEIDLVKDYMPFMAQSKLLKNVARNCRLGYCLTQIPFLDKREAFFQGIGYDRMKHNGTILMFTRSLNDRPDLQEQFGFKIHQTPGVIQLEYKYFILQYTPITPKSGNLKLALNLNLKLKLPIFLLKPACENFGIDYYENIIKTARKFSNSKWQKKVEENPQFFKFLKKRVCETIQN